VSIHSWAGVSIDRLPALARWLEAVGKRPAAQRRRAVPATPAPPAREEVVDSARKMLA
jgi:glutathione S-transferase